MSEAYCLLLLSLVVRIRCQLEGYIVGGQPAPIIDFPYSVHIDVRCKTSTWNCGGSIINQVIILTAAHCMHTSEDNPLVRTIVSAGNAFKNKGRLTNAVLCAKHENYNEKTHENDIALIKVKTSFSFNKKTSRIALMLQPPQAKEAIIAGWGLINDINYTPTDELQYLTQTLLTRESCEKTLGYLPRNIICAQSQNKTSFVASGDSGSPLVINGYIQIGIVSFKRPKKSKTTIIYTNVSSFYSWITKATQQLLCGTSDISTNLTMLV